MKRFYVLFAAAAALVGCSVEGDNMPSINVEAKDKFTLMANIADDTRVAITGDKFTEVSWLAGDAVKLSSDAGTSATLYAESAGKSVRFVGEGEAKADVDNYYAVYGRSGSYSLSGGVVTLNYAEQYGGAASAAALLVGKAEGVSAADLSMSFSPANALLRVSVSGVSVISKAEFYALDGSSFATSYSYNIATDEVSHTATGSLIEVNAPSASGFFVALPADLDMPNYVVRLTDANGNVCTKAYAAKTFAKGTTTRVDFEWTTPTVKLGAKSSYTYFNDYGDDTSANSESFLADPAKIFFTKGVNNESCASTYAGVQDAVIEDLGYEIDGVDLSYSAGKVSWDKAANNFVLNAEPSYNRDWGRKTNIKAYIKVGGVKMYSTNVLWITGLPHRSNWFSSDDRTGWSTTGTTSFDSGYGFRTLYYYLGSAETGEIYSPSVALPSNTNVHYDIKACYYTTGLFKESISLITGITTGTNKPSTTQTKSFNRVTTNATPNEGNYTLCPFDAVMGNGQRVYITDDHGKDGNAAQNWFSIGSCVIKYRK